MRAWLLTCLPALNGQDNPETVRRLWAEEMLRRDQEVETGEVETIPGEVVFQRVADKLAQVRKSAK